MQSFVRAVAEEGRRILQALGFEIKIFDPVSLPFPDAVPDSHPKVQKLRELALWSEGMVWSSLERHGAMTGILKAQIDWIPLSAIGGKQLTQGKTLALMQVSGESHSLNAVNKMGILGHWMRMITILNQSPLPKAWLEFESGQMKQSSFYNRIVYAMEELAHFPVITLGHKAMLADGYSERVESAEELHKRVSLR